MNFDGNWIVPATVSAGVSVIMWLIGFFILPRKDREELDLKKREEKRKLVKEAYQDKVNFFAEYNKVEDKETFEEFVAKLQYICVLILSESIIDEVFKYIYYYNITQIVEERVIEEFSGVFSIPYSKEKYEFLFDAYELGRKKFEKKVKKKWWNVFALKGRKKVEKKVKKKVKKKWWNIF